MKSFVISMLFAAAAAKSGYECVNPGDAWAVETLTGDAPTDATTCQAACQAVIDAAEAPTDNDWCCAVAVPEAGDVTCGLFSLATADADIRAEATAVDGTTFEAWAWIAGVDADEEEAVDDEEDDDEEDDDEDDEDMSVRITLSALATASIAMLAM